MTSQPDRPGSAPSRYRGRFAPSPTGRLHFGSLVAAIASYLQALSNDGEWLLRIENIDPPREEPGASDAIRASLEAHGFAWHGDVLFQADSSDRFAAAVDRLIADGVAYPCDCSREQIRAIATRGPAGPIYPGTCRNRAAAVGQPNAIRVRTSGAQISFDDRLQGRIDCDVERTIGDFIIRRKDGLFGYSLAVVVDDQDQGITEVVRGADLLDFTPAQIHLQRLLGCSEPDYCHVPVIVHGDGAKLSKQTGAQPLEDSSAARNLVTGLALLGQAPPERLAAARVNDVWNWARENWRPEKLRGIRKQPKNN